MKESNALLDAPYPSAEPLNAVAVVAALAALAQPTRLAIFRRLVEFAPEGLTVGAIGEVLDLAPATLSFHLKELSHAGLVTDQRESRHIRYRADFAAMNALIGYLTDNCCHGRGRLVDSAACVTDCAPDACDPTPARPRKRP